jgi:hypothetical protein
VKSFGKQQEVKFEHAVKGLRAMGYRGLTLGEGDLKLSPGSLLAAIGSADDGKVRDFLSANVSLYDRDVQPRYLVLEAGGKKIGVTAVLGETYERQIRGDDIVHVLQNQLEETLPLLHRVSEEKSLHRYAPDKWNIRQMWNHVNDAERVFLLRALWFARGHTSELPSFEQDVAAGICNTDEFHWAGYVEEFREIRLATISFFRNMPEDAWLRTGKASGNLFTVRACAYIVAGHVAHHSAMLREKYF